MSGPSRLRCRFSCCFKGIWQKMTQSIGFHAENVKRQSTRSAVFLRRPLKGRGRRPAGHPLGRTPAKRRALRAVASSVENRLKATGSASAKIQVGRAFFASLFHLWIRARFAARRTFGRSLATRNGGASRIDHHRLSGTGRGRARRGPPHAARFAASPAKPGGPPFQAAPAWVPRFAVTLAGGAGRCRPAGSALAGGVGAKAPTSS